MVSSLNDSKLETILDCLYAQNNAQKINAFDAKKLDVDMHRFLSDKMVALDRDKAEFCYLLCRSLRAACVVEAGTSFGVSTLYLAAAVRDNQVENGVVIGTEYESKKVEAARENFKEAGLDKLIELREGDLCKTLQNVEGPVDFMLLDIWEVALPALELLSSSLRPGAIVVADNTATETNYYRDFFQFVNDPKNRFRTMTVPFEGGLEVIVRV